MQFNKVCILLVLLFGVVNCEGGNGSQPTRNAGPNSTFTNTSTTKTLVSITVLPSNPSVTKGIAQQFTATGTFSDNTTQALTASVTWSSSNISVATISNASGTNGNATTLAAGSTTITAISSNSVVGETSLTVTAGGGSTPDTIPPSVPGNLSAKAVSSSQINLSWNASSDNVGVAGYQIFRDGQLIATTSTTFYSDTGLIAGTTHTYTVSAVDTSGNISKQSSPPSTPTTTLAFDDEFDGNTLDTTQWVAMNRPGDSTNNELQYYLPTNVAISNGWLNITSKADKSMPGYSYTSEMVQWKSFNFTYGTIEFRAKLAGGQGTWPAIWLLGSNCQQTNITKNILPCNWPEPGSDEIDITEIFHSNTTTVNQQIHSGSINTGCSVSTTDVSQNWHTYSLIWAPGSLTWQIDGVTTCTITNGVPSTPMFLVVNTAMGGVGGGAINDSTLPQTLSLDYVRVTY